MARRGRSDYEEQIDSLGRAHIEQISREMESVDRNISSMLDRQRDMVMNFYRASTEAGRESVRLDLQSRQESMQEQLNNMKRNYAVFSKFMSKADKKNFQRIYNARNIEFQNIERDIKELSGVIEDEVDNISETFSERFSRVTEEIRDTITALNINSIADDMKEDVDSYIENLRQVKSRTGSGLDNKEFGRVVSEATKDVISSSRVETSEALSTFMMYTGIKKTKDLEKYAKDITAMNKLQIDYSQFENIMWQDQNTSSNGKLLRSISNISATLTENQELNVVNDRFMSSIDEKMGLIYGIAEGDSKKTKRMVNSLAVLEATAESAANTGVDDMVSQMNRWITEYGTVYDYMNDENFTMLSTMTGYNPTELAKIFMDGNTEGQIAFTTKLQDMLKTMNDTQVYAFANDLGFDNTASLKAFANYDDLSSIMNTAFDSVKQANNVTETSDISLQNNLASETTGWWQEQKNEWSNNPIIAAISDFMGEIDFSLQDAASLVIIGSQFKSLLGFLSNKGLGSVITSGFGKFNGMFSGLGGKLGGLFNKGAASAGGTLGRTGGFFSKLGGLFNKGAASAGASGGSTLLGGLGSSLSSAGSSMMAGTAAQTGGLALAGTAALGVAGGAMAIKDAVGGYKKSEEWLGEDGKTVYGKLNSTVAGAIGGTGPGLGQGNAWDVAKNTGANALKGAAIGGAIGSVIPGIGTAIGAAIGGGIGTVTGLIGGERLAKTAQATWNFTKQCASEAFNSVGVGVEAVNGVLQELGPVGQTLGNTLTESWGAVTETKDKITEVWADPNKGLVAKIGGTVSALFSGAGKVAVSVVKGFKEISKKAWDKVSSMASKAWNGIKDTANAVWNGFQDGITTIAEAGAKLYEGAGALASGVGDMFKGIGEGASSVVDSATGGGLSGIIKSAGESFGAILSGAGDLVHGKDAKMDSNPILDKMDIMIAYLRIMSGNSTTGGSIGLAGKVAKVASVFGFKNGLSYVPNDGLAMIHKGEAVLTSKQADAVRAQADGGIDVINSETSSTINSLARTVGSLVTTISDGMSTVDDYYKNDKKSNKAFVKALNKSGLFGIKLNSLSSKGNLFTTTAMALIGGNSSSSGGFLGSLIQNVRNVFKGLSNSNGTSIGGSTGYEDNTLVEANTSGLTGNKKEFIDKIKPGAIAGYKKYHVLPSLTLAQGALESGWGKHAIGNNLFGIKAGSSWKGKTKTVRTAEYDKSGNKYYINAAFRDYNSLDDSVVDHAKLLTGKRYAKVVSAKNYKEAARAVAAAGYATSPTYAQSLINLIESNGLNAWDNQYAKGTPWLPNDQVALVHEGEMIVPADVNPMNNPSDTIPLGNVSDNSDTVETLKWMVYRLEAKFDKLISLSSNSRTSRKAVVGESNTDRVYSF